MKKRICLSVMIILSISMTACNIQTMFSPENDSNFQTTENATVELQEDEQALEHANIEVEVGDLDDEESEPAISEEEIKKLVDGNYFCITNVYKYGRLSMDEGENGRIPVSDEFFTSFSEYEAYVRSIYVKDEADYLLYEYCSGFPLYYEKDGIFYQREELFGGGMVCPWESYTIENIEVKGKECTFSVYATYPAEISPEGVSGACYNFLAIYEDEWKLAFIVSKSDCSVEETKEYLEEDRAYVGVDIDYENLITEKEALDIAYDYFYKDSNMEAYRVYCDKMPYFDSENNASVQNIEGIHYEENSVLGYVVAQYSGSNDIEIFDNTNPSPEKDKICLTYLGKSENDAFYVFWLYSYISDGDGNYHYSTLDYILVTADGREVVCERCDVQGNYIEDVTAWKDFRKFLNCTILNSWIF